VAPSDDAQRRRQAFGKRERETGEVERPRRICKRRTHERMSPLDNDLTVKEFLATWKILEAAFLVGLIIRNFFLPFQDFCYCENNSGSYFSDYLDFLRTQ
jgi:hypothetical protein